MDDPSSHESDRDPSSFDGFWNARDPARVDDLTAFPSLSSSFLGAVSDGLDLSRATAENDNIPPDNALSRPVPVAQIAGSVNPAGHTTIATGQSVQGSTGGQDVAQHFMPASLSRQPLGTTNPQHLPISAVSGGSWMPSHVFHVADTVSVQADLMNWASADGPFGPRPDAYLALGPQFPAQVPGRIPEGFEQYMAMEFNFSFGPGFSHLSQLPPSTGIDALSQSVPTLAGNVFAAVPITNRPFDVSDDPSWSESKIELSPRLGAEPVAELIDQPASSASSTPAPRGGSRDSTSSTEAPVASPPRPARRGQKKKKSGELNFISYNPGVDEGEQRKKRPASDIDASPDIISRERKKTYYNEKDQSSMLITFGSPNHHRSQFEPDKRRETRLARREGVCTRCQGSKRRCDLALKESLYEPCTRCSKSKLYKGVSPIPCFKSILRDIQFFRPGPAANEPLFTTRFTGLAFVDISKPNVPVRDLLLTQFVGGHKLIVYASEFVPLPNDKVSLKWKDGAGNEKELKLPPYCLTNMQKVTSQIQRYIDVAKDAYLDKLQTDSDDLVARTVAMARKYARTKPRSLVKMALNLWAISRIIEIEWQMCGSDTLGVHKISDPSNLRYGKIPIPPMMDTQLDQIVIKNILDPLRKELLEQFEERTSPLKPEDWFDVYLTSFILLSHIERLAQHSETHAKLHGMPTKFSNIPFLVNVFHTAKVILSRFHFFCNGSAPLRINWSSPSTLAMAKVDADQVDFMKTTQALIKAREMEVMDLRAKYDYGRSLHWSGQLFTDKWDNSPARVIEA